jgi:hypothetical protein
VEDNEAVILFNFFMWFRENGEKHIDKSIEKMIQIYLSEKNGYFN